MIQPVCQDLSDENIDLLLSCFKQLLKVSCTELLQLFASMCIESLDLDQWLGLKESYSQAEDARYADNLFLYTALNGIK